MTSLFTTETAGTWRKMEKIILVMPSEARDLKFAAKCISLAKRGMTIHRRVRRAAEVSA